MMPENNAKKAGGAALASAGGISLLNGLQILQDGRVSFDNSVHLQLPAGETQTIADVTDTSGSVGSSLVCNNWWSVGPFALGQSAKLDGKAALADQLKIFAQAIHSDAPHGTILLIGSGDNNQARYKNVQLATDRATVVRKALDVQMNKLEVATPRDILSVNDVLTGGSTGSLINADVGLARLLYGRKEASARNVIACVIVPPSQQPAVTHHSILGHTDENLPFLRGIITGITIADAVVVAAMVAVIFLAVMAAQKLSKKSEDDNKITSK